MASKNFTAQAGLERKPAEHRVPYRDQTTIQKDVLILGLRGLQP